MFARRIITVLRRSYSEKAFQVHWVDEYRSFLQMKAIKFKYWMTVPRTITLALPKLKPKSFSFSISDLAGNFSFVVLAVSYMESEFINLRAYALCGITMSIIFQYYRERPLWIPIRWNSVFLLINGAMLLVLLKEKNDADNIPDEQKFLFQTVFQSKGMKPVDYLHLINSSERLEFKKGEKIVSQDRLNTRVCLVKKGKLMVARGNEKVGTINQNQFVGAMSFLTWSGKVDAERAERAERQRQEQKQLYKRQQEMPAEVVAVENEDGITVNPDAVSGNNTSGDSVALTTDNTSSSNGDSASSNDEDDGSNIKQSGWADVICEEDCVVFSWNFSELKELTEANPNMGMVLERCISEDLNRKMANNWQDEPKNRYKQLLTGALMDGEITPEKRAMIQKARDELHINEEEHLQVLHMVDWTKEQFEVGYKESPPAEVLAKYTRSLKRCMDSDEGFTEDDRTSLRKFRLSHNISYRRHLALLKQFGWSADQYEAGTKAVESITMDADEYLAGGDVLPAASLSKKQQQQDTTALDRYYYAKRAYNFFTTGNPDTPKAVSSAGHTAVLTSNTVATSRTPSPIRARAKHFTDDEGQEKL